jgi:solute:Na+ symporter, SSS family
LLASPFLGLACDFMYENYLCHIEIIKNTFGEKFNFLYRVFSIFVLDSILIYVLSLSLNVKNKELSEEATELTVPLAGLKTALMIAAMIHVPLLLLVGFAGVAPQMAAYPAAVLTFGAFVWYMKNEERDYPFYESDLLYAGFLSAAMVWIMYYFA